MKLESIMVGGQRMTTLPAVDRFLTQLNDISDGGSGVPAQRSPSQRLRESNAAGAKLDAIGA